LRRWFSMNTLVSIICKFKSPFWLIDKSACGGVEQDQKDSNTSSICVSQIVNKSTEGQFPTAVAYTLARSLSNVSVGTETERSARCGPEQEYLK